MNPYKNFFLPVFILIGLLFTGCDAILGIFEAGFWVGIILVIVVIVLIIWLVRKFFS